MPLKDVKYKYDQSIVKIFGFGDYKKIKVIRMNVLRNSGVEDDKENTNNRCCVNSNKLDENISRTKSKIFELAFCNPWDYFFTGTIDKSKYDRTDLKKYHKDLTQFIRDYRKKYKVDISFLFIPELHSDGQSWHIHGFIYGLPKEHLKQFQVGDVMGKALADKVVKGDIVFNWVDYQKKFGFCDLEPIRNHEAVCKYITKYINKNLANSVTKLNAHQYYHSRGLKFAETMKKGTMSANIVPTYENEYCSVSWLDYSDELLKELVASFW